MNYNSPVANDGYEGAASYSMLDSSFAAVENNNRYEREKVDFSKYLSKINPILNQKPVKINLCSLSTGLKNYCLKLNYLILLKILNNSLNK